MDAAGAHQAGFLAFPAGSYRRDLTASPRPGYFDRAVSAWLPVGRQAVSPDGLHYAVTAEGVLGRDGVTVQTPATLHIVAASTGADRVIPLTGLRPQTAMAALSLEVVDFESDAVYGIEFGQAGVGELFRVDLSNGSVTDLDTASRPEAVESGGFWFGGLDPNANMGAHPINLERWDLGTQTTSRWFDRPSAEVTFLGLDHNGAAVVLVVNTSGDGSAVSTEIWLVSEPGKETRIYSAASGIQALVEPISMIADAHGLWFGSPNGIYLYSSDTGFQKVSDYAGAPANGCH
jgi:hypothetical protein